MKHFTATREGTDKRNSNGQTGQGEHCLLDVWLSEYIQHITLQRLNPGRKKENVLSVILTDHCSMTGVKFGRYSAF